METIEKRETNSKNYKAKTEIKKSFSIETEISEMKNDIKELKKYNKRNSCNDESSL